MHIAFYGAVREVTGSMHLICTEGDRILLDCGMFQGSRKISAEKNRILPFDPRIITNVVLSHAHIDHSGRIPLLTRNNYNGRIFCTRASADICQHLLPDAAHIQESDADYLNYKTLRGALSLMESGTKGKPSKRQLENIKKRLKNEGPRLNVELIRDLIGKYHLEKIEPLYSIEDAKKSLEYFEGIPYHHPVSIGKDATLTFYEAGHILGSAISIIRLDENGKKFTIAYTGDIGRFGKPIIRDPNLVFDDKDSDVDLLIMESTYGNRLHEPVSDLKPTLAKIITETLERKGSIIIPAFAFGRTQEILYILHELYDEGAVPKLPIFVDSPLATNITRVFGEHPEIYDK